MNEIYQQKMERYSEEYVFENCEKEGEVFLVKDAYQKGWCNALQNQWISVEEALPEFEEDVFVMNADNDFLITWRSEDSVDADEHGFVNYHVSKITHWMPIPEIKGGEK